MKKTSKFAGLAKVGDTIISLDHTPVSCRTDSYVEGVVVEVNPKDAKEDCYVVLCSLDTTYQGLYSRVGKKVIVPMELIHDFDERVKLVEAA